MQGMCRKSTAVPGRISTAGVLFELFLVFQKIIGEIVPGKGLL
jgi:hypothetical protein